MRKSLYVMLALAVVVIAGLSLAVWTQPKFPVPDKIPGVTLADPAPNGCVDCHTSDKASDKLAKITVLLDEWNKNGAPANVKAAAQLAVATAGGTPKITGKHPLPGSTFKGQDLPGDPDSSKGCFMCHNAASGKSVPRLDMMLYLLKFGDFDGKDKFVTPTTKSEFVSKLGGWCTACHTFEGFKDKDGALTSKLLLKQGKEK